jgi:hypothetical protein
MLSQEFQVVENSTGDYWSQASFQGRCEGAERQSSYKFNPNGHMDGHSAALPATAAFARRAPKWINPIGQWNEIELITYGDKSLHIVNGKVVMALKNSRYKDGDGDN